jgi:nucleoid DNA-binding protein
MAARKDLIQAFRDRAGLTVRESALCADALVEWVGETLASGRGIELRGLGSFKVTQVAEKIYPSTFSKQSVIPAHGRIIFRPCEKLKTAVRNRKA